MKKKNIKPTGLKGKDKMNRVKHLMETISPSNEDTSNPIGLTKLGPDGKIYAIVRENQEFYIKTTNKKKGVLMVEDFDYIGGLANKKMECHPTYEKAIKRLNLKFHSIKESLGVKKDYNVFKSDNLINENLNNVFDYEETDYVDEEVHLSENEKDIEEILDPTPEVKVEMTESENAVDEIVGDSSNNMSILDAINKEDEEINEKEVKNYLSNLSEAEILALHSEILNESKKEESVKKKA